MIRSFGSAALTELANRLTRWAELAGARLSGKKSVRDELRLEMMERRIAELEDENRDLRARLAMDADQRRADDIDFLRKRQRKS